MKKIGLCLCALTALSLAPNPAHATDNTDVMVALKTLPVMATKITGAATMGVVYDAANPESKADADAIKAVVDGMGDAPGGAKLTAVLVGSNEMAKLASAKIAFLAKGVSSATFDAVASAASAGILTVSTDMACVKANKCVLGVASKPSVEIYFSKAAADGAKISFVPAFTMLAKQI